MVRNIFWENVIKNIIIVFVLLIAYSQIHSFLFSSDFTQDKSVIGSLLVVVSILAVTACFGNFAFTYEKIKVDKPVFRLLAHVTTGLLMFLIGLSLELTSVLVKLLVGNFYILDFSLLILYMASVLYDFWDLNRAE